MIDFDRLTLGPAMRVFGELVTYLPGTGPTRLVNAIFDNSYRRTELDRDGIPIITTFPALGARQADFAPGKPVQGEAFTIRGRTWRIVDPPERDVEGHLLIKLTAGTDADAARPALPPVA